MRINSILIPVAALVAVSGSISSPIALLIGVALALAQGNPYADKTKFLATALMAIAIVGLGAGVPLGDVLSVGAHGIIYTIIGILFTFVAGYALGKKIGVEKDISILVTAGTAICGGSAIAAISRVISARQEAIAVSLGCVFLLNALALFIFPVIGHALDLTQTQFGLWAGLAIHDTSSVIGAAIQFGDEAIRIATTTKLARAIWIIPLAFIIGFMESKNGARVPVTAIVKRCWFIGGFLLMAILASYTPLGAIAPTIELVAKRLMALVLFLIGTGMTKELLRQVGFKPFVQGFLLWIAVSAATLGAIMAGWISI